METYTAQPGFDIHGRSFFEHSTNPTGSWKNNVSFWPSERSLVNLLAAAGFGYVAKPLFPFLEWPWKDRVVYVATAMQSTESPSRVAQLPDPDKRPPPHHARSSVATSRRQYSHSTVRDLERNTKAGRADLAHEAKPDRVIGSTCDSSERSNLLLAVLLLILIQEAGFLPQ